MSDKLQPSTEQILHLSGNVTRFVVSVRFSHRTVKTTETVQRE